MLSLSYPSRRLFLQKCIAAGIAAGSSSTSAATGTDHDRRTRVLGLLVGTVIGDAAGGPVEFLPPERVAHLLVDGRHWPEKQRLEGVHLERMARQFQLLPYAGLRETVEPYGPWQAGGPAGVVTDDTRHKMILLAALRHADRAGVKRLDRTTLAAAYLDYYEGKAVEVQAHRPLWQESLREYAYAARAVLDRAGEQLPPERLWAGLPTCSGQMTMLPLAARYIGRPEEAYRVAYEASFFDQGIAKDINAAVVAGLADALAQPTPRDAPARREAWRRLRQTMRTVDPFRYGDVPFAERPVARWLDFAEQAVERSDGRPRELYRILEEEGAVRYFWEAHHTFAAAIAFALACDGRPLAALALALDFGHDADSVAQLLGALIGAIHGPTVFPQSMRDAVAGQLQAEYDESLEEWATVLVASCSRRP